MTMTKNDIINIRLFSKAFSCDLLFNFGSNVFKVENGNSSTVFPFYFLFLFIYFFFVNLRLKHLVIEINRISCLWCLFHRWIQSGLFHFTHFRLDWIGNGNFLGFGQHKASLQSSELLSFTFEWINQRLSLIISSVLLSNDGSQLLKFLIFLSFELIYGRW